MKAAWSVAAKDLQLLRRDRIALFLVFGLPVLYAAFFGAVFDGIGRAIRRVSIDIALVDQDDTPASRDLIANLLSAGEVRVERTDLAGARELVRRGAVNAFIRIPRGFEQAVRHPWAPKAAIEIGLSPRYRAAAGLLRGLLLRVMLEDPPVRDVAEPNAADVNLPASEMLRLAQLLQNAPEDPDERAAAFDAAIRPATLATLTRQFAPLFRPTPIEITSVSEEARPRNAFEVSFPQGMMWGVLSCAAGFGAALAREREQGTLLRLALAPIPRRDILLGKAFACFSAIALMSMVLITFSIAIFGVRPDRPWLLAPAMFATAVSFTGVMMLIASFGRGAQSAASAGWAVLIVLGMLGGALVPVYLMPHWLQHVSQISPVYWVLLIFEGALWRDFSWVDAAPALVILLSLGGVCFALGARHVARRPTV